MCLRNTCWTVYGSSLFVAVVVYVDIFKAKSYTKPRPLCFLRFFFYFWFTNALLITICPRWQFQYLFMEQHESTCFCFLLAIIVNYSCFTPALKNWRNIFL